MTKEELLNRINQVTVTDDDFWQMLNNHMETLLSIFATVPDSAPNSQP